MRGYKKDTIVYSYFDTQVKAIELYLDGYNTKIIKEEKSDCPEYHIYKQRRE